MSGATRRPISPEQHEFPLSATLGGVAVLLNCSALRYPVSQRGVTLVLTHGISGCKEHFHTAITRFLSLQDATYDVREVWSLDFPNHGKAATLNRHLLDAHKENGVRQGFDRRCIRSVPPATMDIGAYLSAFLSLPRFRGHNIVGMGHSGSCTAWVHALTRFAHVYPNALILLEPTLMFPSLPETDSRAIHGAANVRGALAKRDSWPSRTELRHWLTTSGRSIWARWDPRVLELHVEHAFEEVVTSDGQGSHITPRLHKDEEASLYTCLAHTIEPSQLAAVCRSLDEHGRRGVHIIWAGIEEFIPKTAKEEILEAAEHRIRTQRTVIGSGHLVPQLKPDALGDVMHEVLGLIGSDTRSLL